MSTEFRVNQSEKGHRVVLYRKGLPYVTFADGLTKEAAEREAHLLSVLWSRIRREPEILAATAKYRDS